MTGISIDPFDKDQLANIHRHHWKECIKMSKLAKFESDMSEVSKDIVWIYVWWVQTCPPTPPHTNVCKMLRLCRAISSLTSDILLSNLVSLLILRCYFQWFNGYSLIDPYQKLKIKTWKGLFVWGTKKLS